MTDSLWFEWLKVTKRWMPRVVIVLTLGVIVAFFWGTAAQHDPNLPNIFFPRGLLASLVAAAFIAPILWPVLGGSWAGSEYGWGSIRVILSRRPHRIGQAVAGLSVLLAVIGITLVCVLITGVVTGAIAAALTGHAASASGVLTGSFALTLVKTFLATWYASAFLLLLAYAAAILFRSAAAGIAVGVGSTLAQMIGISILLGAGGVWRTIAEHLPLDYTQNLVGTVAAPGFAHGTTLSMVNPGQPSISESIVALGLMMLVLLAATIASVRTQDVTA
jgi:ABC-type transport system involved in multi-copper enzyme maturation permease subunit